MRKAEVSSDRTPARNMVARKKKKKNKAMNKRRAQKKLNGAGWNGIVYVANMKGEE